MSTSKSSSGSSTKTHPKLSLEWSRVLIEQVSPAMDAGDFPVKRTVGESVHVKARIFCDGHDKITAEVLFKRKKQKAWVTLLLQPIGNDWWQTQFIIEALEDYEFCVRAWIDPFETWREELLKKWNAQVSDIESCFLEGAALLEGVCPSIPNAQKAWFTDIIQQLKSAKNPKETVLAVSDPQLQVVMLNHAPQESVAESLVYAINVDRPKARFSSWYEFFPRSTGEKGAHGNFKTATKALDRIAAMGFDVIYLPPIHPIGLAYRKGPNNTLKANASDPGSPWAIGSKEGGHKAVHPELGSIADFKAFVKQANKKGLEVALDIAFQCSPDHPYVKDHPEWFRHRPDGTIKYAENPPKKYQDIYPFDFECEAWPALWQELKSVVEFWIEQGVFIFRVDNPHTKPLAFWEWLIAEIRQNHPETLFLAEAFTRPAIMKYLAKIGFSQSYSYFTWRNTKRELSEFVTELTQTDLIDCMRPNFFANTPDILHEFLQSGGRPSFEIRLILAATLGANYGIYGPPFELCIGDAMPASEEYRDSEKYQVRTWDLASEQSIEPLVTRINTIRKNNPALQYDRYVEFLETDNAQILAYTKSDPASENIILTIVNLDPFTAQAGWVQFKGADWGEASYQVHDLLSDARYLWQGKRNYVSLDPSICPAHVFKLRKRIKNEKDFEYYQ